MKREMSHSIFVIDAEISASVGMDEAVALLFWPLDRLPVELIYPLFLLAGVFGQSENKTKNPK